MTQSDYRKKNYKELVTSYYEVITNFYRKFWNDSFHLAVFQNSRESFEEALARTDRMYMEDSGLNKNKSAIDLGCGIGTLACYVARETKCQSILGITISPSQVKLAKQMAKQKKLANTSFLHMDVMEVDALKDKFDTAFLIEVGCHLPDKTEAIKKISKILKPGGRLIIADWLQKERPNVFERDFLIEPFCEYWNYPYLETISGYKKIIEKAGFRIVRAEDFSEQIKPNWEKFYRIAIEEVQQFNLIRALRYTTNPAILVGKDLMKFAKYQFNANVFAKICSDAGVLKFAYF